MLLGGPCEKKVTMKESNGSRVLQIHVIFPLMQVNSGKIRSTGFHSTIYQLPLFCLHDADVPEKVNQVCLHS